MSNRLRTDGQGVDGFTLVELLVVLGIIALLAALVAPQVLRYLGDARADVGRTQIKNIESALELYYLDTGEYPSEKMGLVALVKKPGELVNWRGPYLRREEALLDPWSRAYLYVIPGKHGPYDVSSFGRDGVAGGEGDDVDLNSW